jgi:hypothetical protein
VERRISSNLGGGCEPGVEATRRPEEPTAVVETGAIIKVPLYLEVGEIIKIDANREYVERVR